MRRDENEELPVARPTPATADGDEAARSELRCVVERVVFRNAETLFTVVAAQGTGPSDPGSFTAAGPLLSCAPGEELLLEGAWTVHPRFGRQFEFATATAAPPSTVEGIEKYLASGAIAGIGKGFAAKIVKKFGKDTMRVLEHEPKRLRKVPGIGRARIAAIAAFFAGRGVEREAMLFLFSHGLTPVASAKIFRKYGADTVEAIRADPYRLAEDIVGIGFATADRIASRLGIAGDALPRVRAALRHCLVEAEGEGHCLLTREQLVAAATGIIGVDQARAEEALAGLVDEGALVLVRGASLPHLDTAADCVFTPGLHRAESRAAALLGRLAAARDGDGDADAGAEARIDAAQGQLGITLAPMQREAVRRALDRRVSIITGGPGTGKTTIVKAVVQIVQGRGERVMLCAPTGRAAKRLAEATGRTAKTIHRLLRWSPVSRTFEHDGGNPLPCDLLVVDETSMVDIRLLAHLVEALRQGCRLLVVGDADQLPSVGPGCVLRDLVRSGRFAVTRLDEIFRQAASSMIVSNAHRINHGLMPAFEPAPGQLQDFFFVDREDPREIADAVVEMAAARIPSRYGLNPVSQVQVLAPMHRGVVGVQALNERLAERLGTGAAGAGAPRIGDKVMQTRNNYGLEVFNGDIGLVVGHDGEERTLTVDFDGRQVTYEPEDALELVRAYAISIHKSQGSEYEGVVVPLSTSHYIMLQRNLVYTALTRARRVAVLVGTKKALAMAVRNDKVRERNTLLSWHLERSTE